MAVRSLTFRVLRDEEAGVFYTECDETCGIVAEAETVEELRENLLKIIPEALEINDAAAVKEAVSISLQSQQFLQFHIV